MRSIRGAGGNNVESSPANFLAGIQSYCGFREGRHVDFFPPIRAIAATGVGGNLQEVGSGRGQSELGIFKRSPGSQSPTGPGPPSDPWIFGVKTVNSPGILG